MDLDALRGSPVGQLVPISGNDAVRGEYSYFAFVPNRLPEPHELELTTQTWSAVFRAGTALGQLRQACVQLPNPKLLIAPALAREALDTSALEGTFAALPDVLEARLPRAEANSPEVAEVRAYETIANEAFAWIRDRPITLQLLADLQGELMRFARGPSRDPGRIRGHQVLIGARDGDIAEARFVPPPPDDRLTVGLEDWQRWVQSETTNLPPPLRAALAHYQFETLHPFGDGNGRIGRLVVSLMLLREGALPEPAFTLSPWLLKRREDYQRLLLATSQNGDWNAWVTFFCSGVQAQAQRAVDVAQQLLDWQGGVRAELAHRRWTGTIYTLFESLVEWPVISIPWAVEQFGVSFPTASGAIERLVEIGVLAELTGRRYGRFFGAADVMRIVDTM